MWILTCTGPSLQNKRKWLRPGSSYIIGRKPHTDDLRHGFSVSPRWVSREHLEIKVHSVIKGSLEHTSARSELELIDKNTAQGTLIGNSVKIIDGQSVMATGMAGSGPITIRLGARQNPETTFTLTWSPFVITVSSSEMNEVIGPFRTRLEDMDVKILGIFHPLTCCYVKCPNKTSSRLLYALLANIPIVTPDYISALLCTEDAMEGDFDQQPSVLDYLPDPDLAANPKRQTCFSGLAFYFTDPKQYEAIGQVISAAGGRSISLDRSKYSTSQDIIDFISKNNQGNAPIILRSPNNESKDEVLELSAAKLGLRLVENHELLNSLIKADPEKLHAKSAKRSISVEEAGKPNKRPRRMRREPRIVNFLDVVRQESSQQDIYDTNSEINEIQANKGEPSTNVSKEKPYIQVTETPVMNDTSISQYNTAQSGPVTIASAPTTAPEPIEESQTQIRSEIPFESRSRQNISTTDNTSTEVPRLVPDLEDEPFENWQNNGRRSDLSNGEDELESINYLTIDKIRQLTSVNNCIEINEQDIAIDNPLNANKEWQGRPNYKRFTRRGQASLATFDQVTQETVRRHTQAFQKRDRETMEMLQNTAVTPDIPDNDHYKRARSEMNDSDDEDEGYMSHTASLDSSTAPSAPEPREKLALFISDDDEGRFRFRYS